MSASSATATPLVPGSVLADLDAARAAFEALFAGAQAEQEQTEQVTEGDTPTPTLTSTLRAATPAAFLARLKAVETTVEAVVGKMETVRRAREELAAAAALAAGELNGVVGANAFPEASVVVAAARRSVTAALAATNGGGGGGSGGGGGGHGAERDAGADVRGELVRATAELSASVDAFAPPGADEDSLLAM